MHLCQFRHFLVLLVPCVGLRAAEGQTVTQISAQYRNGQIFLTWTNLPGADTGFYYIYTHSEPITEANIQQSTYVGRVVHNSAFNYRLTYALRTKKKQFFVINDMPYTVLDSTMGFFVYTCTQANAPTYFAVRCDYGKTSPNWQVVSGANTTTTPILQGLDPVRAYYVGKVKAGGKNDTMEIYVHYGGNVASGGYPAMANEGCLAFHFGIIKAGPTGSNLPLYAKFHGGNGDFINAAISTNLGSCWKLTFDDWIPAFQWKPEGANTRWLGYHEDIDIYTVSDKSAPPTSGRIKAYTFHRIVWTLGWIQQYWPGSIDSTRIYLTGSSQGAGGALLQAVLNPQAIAAINITDGKFNLAAPDDSNPDCKYNEGKSGRTDTRVLWGNEDLTNLETDVTVPNTSGTFFRIYDITNLNYMLAYHKYHSLPFIMALSGKNDTNTCWEEKVVVYSSVQANQTGGRWYWDLHDHSGGQSDWPALKLSDLSRFTTRTSYPAFSNGDLDSNPGSSVNPDPPYYSGDDIGTIHGYYEWDPNTLIDSAHCWQVNVWIRQDTLKSDSIVPASLPTFSKVDLTIRRAQQFTGFAKKTTLHWCNIYAGDTIKVGTVKQKYSSGVPKPLTVKKVKIYPGGNIIRFQTTPFQKQMLLTPGTPPPVQIYPSPATDHLWVQVSSGADGGWLTIYSATGTIMYRGWRDPSQITPARVPVGQWPAGWYVVRWESVHGTGHAAFVKH